MSPPPTTPNAPPPPVVALASWLLPGFGYLLLGQRKRAFTVGITILLLLALGLLIAFFEAITVLVLRAHYTMDVFTGIVCALWVYSIDGRLAAWVDTLVRQWVG